MKSAAYTIKQHVKGQKGQGFVEYALILGFIALCVVAALAAIPEPLSRIFTVVAETLGVAP